MKEAAPRPPTAACGLHATGFSRRHEPIPTIAWLGGNTARGWTSLIILVARFSGVPLLCLGIMGEYLGRMFMELKRRPLFVFRELKTRGGPGAPAPEHPLAAAADLPVTEQQP